MKTSQGFTLAELLLVIAIIFIIAGIVVPNLDTGLKKQRLDTDTNKLASNITLAQNYAIAQRDGYRWYGILFYNGGYKIVPHDEEGNPTQAVVAPSSINEDGDIPLSEGVTVSGENLDNITFDSRGSLPGDIQITLTSNSSTKTITITRLTGHITIN